MIAGYREGQLLAPFTVGGACNRPVFEIWLETCLIPVLQPGDWVVIDNATFHHGGRIAALIAYQMTMRMAGERQLQVGLLHVLQHERP